MNKGSETFDQLMTIPRMMRILHHKKRGGHGPAADPTRGAGRVLALLKLQDGIPTKEMAHILGIRVTSLNETLARMERDGLVTRTPSEEDKRVLLVQLTEKGRSADDAEVDLPSRLMAGFNDEELDTFSGYLGRVIKAIEDEAGEDAKAMFADERCHREQFFKRAGHSHHGPHGGPCGPHGHHGGPCGPHGPHGGPDGPFPGPEGEMRCRRPEKRGFGHHGRCHGGHSNGMGGHGFGPNCEGWWV